MSPTPRAAALLAAIAVAALVIPPGLCALAALALAAATVVDAASVRRPPRLERTLPRVLSRGVPAELSLLTRAPSAGRVTVSQPVPPGLELAPSLGEHTLNGALVARRRGRHELPAPGVRCEGRLRLGAWYHQPGAGTEVHVYPDLVTARRLALAAREGRLPDSDRRARGARGAGTEFESVREWVPDDDVRHVNWRATQRTGRPMTNQYRLEQTRDVVCLLDTGRLMASPLPGGRTRLDAALDALTAVVLAADALGDHAGAIAFDSEIRRQLRPRRGGGGDVARALFDLQPRLRDSDYARAFGAVAAGKRALVIAFTDLFDDAAARALIDAVPVIARRHAVVVAGVADPDLDSLVTQAPESPIAVYRAAAAVDLLTARERAALLIRRAGAQVVEAPPDAFAAVCVRAYLAAKSRLRL